MTDKFTSSQMIIHKIIPSVEYIKWLTLEEPTIQNSMKVPKIVKPTNKKALLENFGDLV